MDTIDIPIPRKAFAPTVEEVREAILDAAAEYAEVYDQTFDPFPLHIRNIKHLDAHTVSFTTLDKRKFVMTVTEVT